MHAIRPAALLLQRGRSSSVMSVPEDEAVGGTSTPPLCTPPFNAAHFSFNPRRGLLRRSSSTSTLGSMDGADDDDSETAEWTTADVDKLKSVYENCVAEASFDTPFSGVPPSQLLHSIARACQKTYRPDWKHSLAQTRSRALAYAKEKLVEEAEDTGVEATPRPGNCDTEMSTPKRQKLRRSDSMDFLPHSRNLAAVTKLSSKLHESDNAAGSPPISFFPYRNRTDTVSTASSGSLHTPLTSEYPSNISRLGRSMTFSASAEEEENIYALPAAERPIIRSASGFVAGQHEPLTSAKYQDLIASRRPSLYTAPSFPSQSASSFAAMSGETLSQPLAIRPTLRNGPSFAGSTETMKKHEEVDAHMYDATSVFQTPGSKPFFPAPYMDMEHSPKKRGRDSEYAPSLHSSIGASSTCSSSAASWSTTSLASTLATSEGAYTPSAISTVGDCSGYFSSISTDDLSLSSSCSGSLAVYPGRDDDMTVQPGYSFPHGSSNAGAAEVMEADQWATYQSAAAKGNGQEMSLESPFEGTFADKYF